MEEYLRLLQEISQKEHALALLKARLQQACPHPEISRMEYVDDDWAQDRTHVLVFRCGMCSLASRMTKEEFEASGGNPFPDSDQP